MKKTIITFTALFVVVFASIFFPVSTKAQTTTELQEQITNLLNQIAQLQTQLLQLQNQAVGQSFVFTNNLTVGSRGNEVSQLQMFLVSRGYLVMPTGVAFGYFGPITQNALANFQASQSITPAIGFFGPITRTRVNSILSATNNIPSNPSDKITTPGIEGIMSVTSYSAGINSTVYEDDRAVPILGLRITARQSDIAVQRIKIDLGNSSRIYNRILSKLYVKDGSNILASVDLNSNTVTKESDNYYVNIVGFNHIVPKDTVKNLVIAADVRPSIDSVDRNISYTIQLADNGVRAIDGANIYLYAPSNGSGIARNFVVRQNLAETASLAISTNSNTPRNQEIIADEGVSNNEKDIATLLIFDTRASRGDITITDLRVNITTSGSGTATVQTAYLYDGSNQIDNTSVSGGVALFQNLDYTILSGTTKTFSVRFDIRNANSNPTTFVASIPTSGIVAENIFGDTISSGDISGSAIGYQIGVRNVGSNIYLVSKSVSSFGVPQNSETTSAMTATFNVRIRAVGGDLILGTPASSTPAFGNDSFGVYLNGSLTTIDNSAKSLSYSIPSGTNTSGLVNSFRISEGTEVIIPVTFQIRGRTSGGTALTSGLYSIGFQQANWIAENTQQTIDFMANDPDWRTTDTSFP